MRCSGTDNAYIHDTLVLEAILVLNNARMRVLHRLKWVEMSQVWGTLSWFQRLCLLVCGSRSASVVESS